MQDAGRMELHEGFVQPHRCTLNNEPSQKLSISDTHIGLL